MAKVTLTPVRHKTLADVAVELRTIATSLDDEPNAQAVEQLQQIADDLDWFHDAYQHWTQAGADFADFLKEAPHDT